MNQDTYLSPPTVANGVAYFGVGYPGKNAVQPFSPYRLYAIAETSGPGGVMPGQVLWQSNDIAGPFITAPTVVNGKVFATALDGKVRAYGLP